MANRTSCVVVLAITLFASYLITSIRFYSRTLSKNGFRWNLSDSIIVASLVLQTVLTGIGLSSIYMSSTAKSQHVVVSFICSSDTAPSV
ncbi:hypothetical protein B0O99DRAFT_85220 [Bisporella sp. PMI_857]|nr:hypothetical protein B0O99DRAFT_85220 [Bisporella sp. PMI_857]